MVQGLIFSATYVVHSWRFTNPLLLIRRFHLLTPHNDHTSPQNPIPEPIQSTPAIPNSIVSQTPNISSNQAHRAPEVTNFSTFELPTQKTPLKTIPVSPKREFPIKQTVPSPMHSAPIQSIISRANDTYLPEPDIISLSGGSLTSTPFYEEKERRPSSNYDSGDDYQRHVID